VLKVKVKGGGWMGLGFSRNQQETGVKLEAARRLRREATPAEAVLWEALRGRRLNGLKFRRQQPLLGFVTDFYCEELNLAIELDGSVHHSTDAKAHDSEREAVLKGAGIKVLRFTNEAVLKDLTAVLKSITVPSP
jgi:very-short-patch-repair endonuclease